MNTIYFRNSLSELKFQKSESLLICDKIFKHSCSHIISQFNFVYFVNSGEVLKEFNDFPGHVNKILKITKSGHIKGIVAMGGGSVGDFAGFFASIFKRGVPLTHIPSTWLAAIDSSHGGKTALNFRQAKNQIGTFYPAQEIYICRELLEMQNSDRCYDAFGELLKISFIIGGKLWKNIKDSEQVDNHLIWENLKMAIGAKYQIVNRDPFEKKGLRHILNLGHTLGHIFEIKAKIPHGIAVNYGIDFALKYSVNEGIMTTAQYKKIKATTIGKFILSPASDGILNQLKPKEVYQALAQDKKRTGTDKVRFIFIKKPGKCLIQEVSLTEIINEVRRQSISPGRGNKSVRHSRQYSGASSL